MVERNAGGEGALNPHHKKRDIAFHLCVGEHLRYIEDRCSAEKMMEVTAAPRLY